MIFNHNLKSLNTNFPHFTVGEWKLVLHHIAGVRIRDAHLSLEAIWEMLHRPSQSICPLWRVWYWQMKTILKCIQCLTFFNIAFPPPLFHYVWNMWRLKCIAMSVSGVVKIKAFLKSFVTYQEGNCLQFKAMLGLFQAQPFWRTQ